MYYFIFIAYILICTFLIAVKGKKEGKGSKLKTRQCKLAISLSILALLLTGAAVYFNFQKMSYFVIGAFFIYCCLLFLIMGDKGARRSKSQKQINTTFILVMMLLILFSFIIYFTLRQI